MKVRKSRQKMIRYEVWYFNAVHPQYRNMILCFWRSCCWPWCCLEWCSWFVLTTFGLFHGFILCPESQCSVVIKHTGRRLLNCSPETTPSTPPLCLFLNPRHAPLPHFLSFCLSCSADFLPLRSGSTNVLLWHFTKTLIALHICSATPRRLKKLTNEQHALKKQQQTKTFSKLDYVDIWVVSVWSIFVLSGLSTFTYTLSHIWIEKNIEPQLRHHYNYNQI